MVFMVDSERAANEAKERRMTTGLHLNFDQQLTCDGTPAKLRDQHGAISDYLKARKWYQILYNPFLRNSFDYVFQAQWNEFCRLYGEAPQRVDGHHHMHLCMNMLVSGRYPKDIKIRRNFTFRPGEKVLLNRVYRRLVDRWLTSRFNCTDYFFSLSPMERGRVQRIFLLAESADVELMVHPGMDEEYDFLLSPEWAGLISKGTKDHMGSDE